MVRCRDVAIASTRDGTHPVEVGIAASAAGAAALDVVAAVHAIHLDTPAMHIHPGPHLEVRTTVFIFHRQGRSSSSPPLVVTPQRRRASRECWRTSWIGSSHWNGHLRPPTTAGILGTTDPTPPSKPKTSGEARGVEAGRGEPARRSENPDFQALVQNTYKYIQL